MNERWYDKTVQQTEEYLNTNANTGLSPSVLKTRQKTDEMNVIYPIKHHSFEECFKKVITEPVTAILFLIAILAAWLEQGTVALVVISMLVFNVIVSVLSYNKAYRILENVGKLSLPTAKVMRNSKMYLIKSEQLVQGDVIYLSAGDIVPADARLVESDNLQVLEVNVTGEVKPVEKDPYFLRYTHDVPPAQQANMLFASSIVIKGTAKAICCYMGEDALVCKLKKNKPIANYDHIKPLVFMKKYAKIWSLISIVMVFAIVCIDLFFGKANKSLVDIFFTALSLSACAVSEFHILATHVIIGNGLFSVVKQNNSVNSGALIKNVSKVDAIKDITCLLVHKDGAFSVKDARIEKVYVNNSLYSEGEVNFSKNASRPLRFALVSTGIYGAGKLVKNNLRNENIYTAEEDAIISIAQRCGVYNINLDKAYPILEHVSSSETSRFETTLVNSVNGFTVACRGDIETILASCTSYFENGKTYPLDPDRRTEIIAEAQQLSRQSYKIVGISSKITHYNNLRRIVSCQTDMTFEGFVAIRQRMLPGAAKNISDCQAAGIKVIMMCDDVGEHNKSLARALGIAKSDEEMVSGNQLNYIKDDMFRTNVGMYKVYEGLSILQKRKLLEYLHNDGEVVGVLVRELDEIILLKEADVGFVQSTTLSGRLDKSGIDMAMAKYTNSPMMIKNPKDSKKTGSEALKFISDVIISDADANGNGGFNAIVSSITASSSICKNIARFVRYTFVTQITRLILVIYSIFMNKVLMSPVQMLFTGLIIDFVAMVIIAFENSDAKITPKSDSTERLYNTHKTLPGALLSGLLWAGSLILLPLVLKLFGYTNIASHSTVVFVGFILSQVAVLNEILRDSSIFKSAVTYNRSHLILFTIIASFLPIINFVPKVAELFGVVKLGWIEFIIAIIPAIIIIVINEISKFIDDTK